MRTDIKKALHKVVKFEESTKEVKRTYAQKRERVAEKVITIYPKSK